MARPRSDEKRNAIIAAATQTIAASGSGAATATIAKAAGVSNGSLFTYFATKADLFNQLYLELKAEMAAAALDGPRLGDDTRTELHNTWSRWLRWAAASPDKRRALAHLDVSDDITAASRQAARDRMSAIAALLERSRATGPMHDAPLALVVALMTALADATIDFMLHDPTHAEAHSEAAFAALWRIIA